MLWTRAGSSEGAGCRGRGDRIYAETGRKGETRGSLGEEWSRQGKGPVQRPWGRNAGVAQGRDEGKE